ncbi:XrtA system polysaccharide deacetylase [Paremcibacter congregatus]|uniref:XrtA system polysaccharide deacetylase n=1 Tax=Paremcibacter congregatus TaxID=2043170 RepID=UPI0030EC5E5C|tara:strand:+ start:14659 stop:15522 length:864 start_codon:yes stop_codon:yes gene_type:complete
MTSSTDNSLITNAMTVDVEDYFQVGAFEHDIDRNDWDNLECRVERNIDVILKMFDDHKVKATFFTLGWIAERFPHVVRLIVENGHELASHGMQHLRVTDQSRPEFTEDVIFSKKILEDIGGVGVKGYRAPSFSIGEKNLWALDVLAEAGFKYSSSIYPIQHDHYGMPSAPRFDFQPIDGQAFIEMPVTTVEVMGRKIPCGGGGYFRLLPYFISKAAMKRVNAKDQQPCIFYFHPWEIDPEQPRQTQAGLKSRFRHYTNLDVMETKIRKVLAEFDWGRMDQVFLERQG